MRTKDDSYEGRLRQERRSKTKVKREPESGALPE